MSKRPIELTPLHFLFHGNMGSIKSYKNGIIPHLLNAAKWLVPRYWKQVACPTLSEWKRAVEVIMEAERWVYETRNQQEKFENIWGGWKNCARDIDKNEMD